MRSMFAVLFASLLLPTVAPSQTLEKIKETGQLTMGFRTDAAPLSFLADNQPQGYSPTICLELAYKLGEQMELTDLDIVFEPVTTEDRFEKVASGEIDMLCGAATITLSRRELVDFSVPIYVDGTTFATKSDGPESLDALAGQKIGVRSGTTTSEALENSFSGMGIEAEIIEFDDHPSGMAALDGDVIIAYFADQSILMNLLMTSGNMTDFKFLEEILTLEKHGLALPRGDTEFRLAVDRGLSELFQDGVIRDAFETAVTGAQPGFALEAMFLTSPTIP